MKTIEKYLLLCFILLSSFSYPQYKVEYEIVEPPMEKLASSEQPGGRMIASIAENGKYVRVLIVFVQFKDDNWNPNWSEWPKNSAPTNWMNTNIIDQTTNQNTNNQNLTHYYTVMSMGHYKVIGNTYHWVTSNTRSEYLSMGWHRGNINRQILQEMDSFIDYAPYDKWSKNAEYSHSWGADGEVDMIWMVYRNIDNDLPNPGYTAYQLGFGGIYWDPISNSWKYPRYSGEASLGGGGILTVDNGTRTIDLGGYGLVSGLTMMMGYNGLGYIKNVLIHEFGHHLLGGTEMHFSNAGLWGMMGGYGSRSQMVNSWERHRLGWINPMQYNYNPLLPIALQDFVTTGQALRILIPGSNPPRYYYLENHQRLSPFDNMDLTNDGKGVYVLYQPANDEFSMSFLNAEGKALWTKEACVTYPNSNTIVPVFKRGIQSPSGYFDTEKIPYLSCVNNQTTVSDPILAFIDPATNQTIFQAKFSGDGRDMLSPGYVEVFNSVSNPSVQGISFQVISENNQFESNSES